MKVYPRYEFLFESCENCVYFSDSLNMTLFDDKAVINSPFMHIELPYTEGNARALTEFIKILVERIKLEEEREKLLQ